jgi:hypothetical protein
MRRKLCSLFVTASVSFCICSKIIWKILAGISVYAILAFIEHNPTASDWAISTILSIPSDSYGRRRIRRERAKSESQPNGESFGRLL